MWCKCLKINTKFDPGGFYEVREFLGQWWKERVSYCLPLLFLWILWRQVHAHIPNQDVENWRSTSTGFIDSREICVMESRPKVVEWDLSWSVRSLFGSTTFCCTLQSSVCIIEVKGFQVVTVLCLNLRNSVSKTSVCVGIINMCFSEGNGDYTTTAEIIWFYSKILKMSSFLFLFP